MTTPAQRAINLMVTFAEDTAENGGDVGAWRDFAAVLDADGCLDGLDEHDARHAIACVFADLAGLSEPPDNVSGGSAALRARADWIAGGAGAWPLHEPAAVVAALRRVCALTELPA